MRFRKQFDEAAQLAVSQSTSIDFSGDPGITSQSDARNHDINEIVRRAGIGDQPQRVVEAALDTIFGITPGQREAINQTRYADVSLGMSYHEALTTLKNAEQAFMDLPASVRSKFRNSPAMMLDAVRAAAAGDADAEKLLESAGVLQKAIDTAQAKPAASAAEAAPAGGTPAGSGGSQAKA